MTNSLASNDIPVDVHAGASTRATGVIRVEHPSSIRRLGEAGLMVLGGAVAALLLLPVPLMHFFGVGLFLVCLFLASRRIGASAVVRSARGICPRCGAEGPFFVGFGRRRLRFPVTTSCGQCGNEVTLHQYTEPLQ